MNAPVTLRPKRYAHVFRCMSCGFLCDSDRSDAITCSPACRVSWHRSERRTLLAETLKKSFFEGVTFAKIARIAALEELCPDLHKRMLAGDKFDWRGDVWHAYWDRMTQAVKMFRGEE